ncbi:pre-rRNA processing protein FTSJ3 [Orchesella cincta]|uniref:Putative rRNA methyltransferase n=1 Tax=Orchesella cincta TaxID=48709 RepID=A0A1D2N9L0_ORCCI|nr:pre-rRNA processing protein FTSJ3 [Orchesella cincta]
MGKKVKTGKQRKDKFYHLAKETGYRSRAAFKLIQLNRKFEFLQKSRVVVDLCAAPGGWMQVAVEHMPVSSLVVGVDLYPIKPISGCISIAEDITTPKCLQLLKRELKTWKADVVLNDGAPNVGQNWIHDAYQQNVLTLSAFKLATELLRPGGYFVTKVFRSKDYNSLIWVLKQFFRNVFATKPAASRTESAEIFVVCKGYLAPGTIDQRFLDPKHVFEEIDLPEGKKQLQQLLKEVGKKKKADGYPTGATDTGMIYRPIPASEFVKSSDYIELLGNTASLELDEEWIANSAATTDDIKDYCKDVKVLGKKEIKDLIQWRKILRAKIEQYMKIKAGIKKDEEGDGESNVQELEEESDTETKLDDAITAVKEQQEKEEKRKKKKLLKEKKKIVEKTSLDMIIPGDVGPTDTSGDSLFTLKTIKSIDDIDKLIVKPALPDVEEDDFDEDDLDAIYERYQSKLVRYNKEGQVLDSSGKFYRNATDEDQNVKAESSDEEEEPDLKKGMDMGSDDEELSIEEADIDMDKAAPMFENHLLTDLDPANKTQKRLKKVAMWFDKDIFKDVDEESDEDFEIQKLAASYHKKGAKVHGFDPPNGIPDEATTKKQSKKRKPMQMDDGDDSEDDELEVVPDVVPKKKKSKLDAAGLALATVMVQTQRNKRDLLDDGWNRYAFNDDGLPDWFIEDEKKHMKKALPVPQELVDQYKSSLKEINVRPIKKVVEAKARKKKRAVKKMEKAKKKAESILENSEMTDAEKANQIKTLYKKATGHKKKEVTYVVAKKFTSAKRMKRPAGVKGPMRVVDPRMKKDMRKMKSMGKNKKGGGGAKGKGAKSGKGGGGGGGRRGGKR